MPLDTEKRGFEQGQSPVGQYYLLDKIAQGGMAEIYKGLAYDLHGIKRTVVIKKILPEISADPEFVNMLINEAKIAVMLSHGNIAQIYDLGKVGDDYFMVMEFVDGQSLSRIHKRCIKNGKLIPIDYVCYFISEVANGLNYMHRRSDEQGRNLGIIHRDISPQNVIVSYSGTVKIIDFGIAKAAIQIHITDSGVLKGKFAYMSPEQASGEMIDQRSDIFSLGVILYELLTGKRLFKGRDKRETLQNVRRCSVPVPSSVRKGLSPALDKIVMKALAKSPKDRYTWSSELRDDLIKFLYTHFPDFQPSSITTFVRDLFKNEIDDMEESEEDAKTPLLIIDHTQSAIIPEKMDVTGKTKVPPQLREFMLDDETPLPDESGLPEEAAEKGPEILPKIKSFAKKGWRKIATVAGGALLLLIVLFITAVRLTYIKPPPFLSWLEPGTKLVLYLDPPDVEVTLGGESIKGRGKIKISNLKHDTPYRLIVEKDGFSPYFETIKLDEGQKKVLYVKLKPAPPHYGTVKITSEPEGATIYIDDIDTNLKTPATISSITPETYHSVGLSLNGYAYWGKDFILKPDEKKSISAKLNVNFGSLQIFSTPNAADVTINGKHAGKTPFKMDNIEPGKIVSIVVTKKGFTTWSKKVKIKGGYTNTFRPYLSRTKEMLIPPYLRNLTKNK